MMPNLTGKLLVASPHLNDGNFLRSIVLIVRHCDQGAFGVMINRPTKHRFRELIELNSTAGTMRDDDQIYVGGPVEGPLVAIHGLAGVGDPCGTTPDATDAAAWISGDEDHLRLLHRRADVQVRYISHYSGWGPSQLDSELAAGGWLFCDASPAIVFGEPGSVWRQAVNECGTDILGTAVPGIKSDTAALN